METTGPDAMQAMTTLSGMVKADSKLLLQIMPVFYHHLQGPLPSTPETAHARIWKNVLAFASLGSMLSCFDEHDGHLEDTEVASSVIGHWDCIWRWSSYLVERYVDGEGDGLTGPGSLADYLSRERVQIIATHLFASMLPERRLFDVMKASPGFSSTYTLLFLRAAQNGDLTLPAAAYGFQSLLSYCLEGDMPYAHDFITTLNSNRDQLSTSCLRIVNDEVNFESITQLEGSESALPLHLDILANISKFDPELSSSLISKGSVSCVAYVLSRLAVHKKSSDSREELVLTASCLRSIGEHLLLCCRLGGFACVVEAIEGRVLTSILKSAHLVRDDSDVEGEHDRPSQTVLVELLEIIGSYSLYRSVLRPLYRSLCRIDNHSTQAHLDVGSPLQKAWKAFRDIVGPRIQMRYIWDRRPHVNFCCNKVVRESSPFLHETNPFTFDCHSSVLFLSGRGNCVVVAPVVWHTTVANFVNGTTGRHI